MLNDLIIIFLILAVIIGFLQQYFYNQLINRKTNQGKSLFEDQKNKGTFDYERFKTLEKEEVALKSDFGYDIKGSFIKSEEDSRDCVILCHGLGGDRWKMMGVGELYLDLGFNILIYDQRHQGKSGGRNVTYGYYEKHDLQKVIDFVKDKYKAGTIGVHGESLGAAAALQHAEFYRSGNNVSFYVADSSFSDLFELLVFRLKHDFNLPFRFLVDIGSFHTRLRAGFYFREVSPVKGIKDVEVPVLFIHGGKDDFVPTQMSVDLFNAKPNNKRIYICSGAEHVKSFSADRAKYTENINDFVENYRRQN